MTKKTPRPADETMMSSIRTAAIQSDPQIGLENKAANVQKTVDGIREAAAAGANLIVLPELVSTGYSFDSREDAYAHAEPVPDGPTMKRWIELAAELGVYVAAGIAEAEGVYLYDTAVLIGPDGYIGRYRKTHLWNREKLVFTPGSEYPVFETKIGRIGLLVCWDIWFPEVPRILAAQGADIICSINNWVFTPPPLFDDAGKCMASYLTMGASHANSVPIVAANRVGEEHGGKFLGCSLITGVNGWPIGGVADSSSETTLYADLDVVQSRSAVVWGSLNDLPRDRRTDLYDSMLGYAGTAIAR